MTARASRSRCPGALPRKASGRTLALSVVTRRCRPPAGTCRGGGRLQLASHPAPGRQASLCARHLLGLRGTLSMGRSGGGTGFTAHRARATRVIIDRVAVEAPEHARRLTGDGRAGRGGLMQPASRADPGPSRSQLPEQSKTATAAVGNLTRIRSSIPAGTAPVPAPAWSSGAAPARVRASPGTAGSCPTTSSVLAAGGSRRIRLRSCAADAWYTRSSKRTGGAAPSPDWASCHVSRARRAGEHSTRSGTRSAARSQRPMTGASRRPRRASGRSWSGMSGQADLACRSSTSRLPAPAPMVIPSHGKLADRRLRCR